MRPLVGRTLAVGHAGDLRDVRALTDAGIVAVVEVADNEPLVPLPRDLVRCRFPLADGGDNPEWLLRLAADTTASLLRAGIATLVCCSAGLSRSLCVAAAGIARHEGLTFRDTLEQVTAACPGDVSPRLAADFARVIGAPPA